MFVRAYVYVIEFQAQMFSFFCLSFETCGLVTNGHVFLSLTYAPARVCFVCVRMLSSPPVMPTSQTCCLTQMSAIWEVWSAWSAAAPTLWPMAAEPTVRRPRGWPSASITSRASNAVMWPDTWARSKHTGVNTQRHMYTHDD